MEPIQSSFRLLRPVESESMRQIINLPTTHGYVNVSTCVFFACKGRCGRRVLIFPHTSGIRTKMARYVPRQPDISEAITSSVIEFSHTSGPFRAASIRSAALSKRPGFPLAKNASLSWIASRLSVLGSACEMNCGMVSVSSLSRLLRFIKSHLIPLDVFAEGQSHVLWWVGDYINLSPKFLFELK